MYHDITITCACGEQFVWTAGEQEFMNDLLEKGKIQEVKQPKRCKECRLEHKRRKADQERGY